MTAAETRMALAVSPWINGRGICVQAQVRAAATLMHTGLRLQHDYLGKLLQLPRGTRASPVAENGNTSSTSSTFSR